MEQQKSMDNNQALIALQDSEERFRLVFEHAPIGMLISDLRGRFARVNKAMADLLGYPLDQLASMGFSDITHPDDLKSDLFLVSSLIKGERPRCMMEKRYIRRNGEIIYVALHVSLVRDIRGRPRYFISQIVDITERKSYEQTIRHMAYHDPLTGLPNRVLLRDKLAVALAQAQTYSGMLAVVFLDLDRFKAINDTCGHHAGDIALKLISERLVSSVRCTDTVARMGGDEFTLMLPNIAGEAEIAQVLLKIITNLEQPLCLEERKFSVSASVGLALYPRDGQDIDTLLQVADKAMYITKQRKGIEL